MIRHYLKMVWNRKRVNGLILIEIFISFIVLFTVLAVATLFTINFSRPLGYSIDRVWAVNPNSNLPFQSHMKEKMEGMKQIIMALRTLPEIESIGGIELTPYNTSTSINSFGYNGRQMDAYTNMATDGLKDVLGVQLTAGRWFSPEDDALPSKPAIINEQLARALYGSDNPVGKELPINKYRVVGVVKDFRKAGEFSQLVNYFFTRISINDTAVRALPYSILIKLRPDVTAAFEERLVKTLQGVEKTWTFDVRILKHEREEYMKVNLVPLIAGGVIAAFLLFMVALGLIGVLWQNVTQRTKEMGLRRALGRSAKSVAGQIHGEQFIISSIGMAAASILILQVPLLGLISFMEPEVYVIALVCSIALMYGITHLCSLIPGWLVMDIEPAEALHYD
ncbi:MAG TPA: ABC transporter permease [Bacteroidota bacterium]|nr:ABC transporter permease [Bacteroidota bacterium]